MASEREHKGFLIKKALVLDGHVSSERQIRSEIASRCFGVAPGVLHESLVSLEIDTKSKLDQANFDSLQESVQRRLVTVGAEIERDLVIARTTFEVRKADLFAALQKEFADLKVIRAEERNALDNAAVEITLREIALSYIEADIGAEVELLKQQQVDAEGLSLDKEVALAEGKLGLANERLRLIDPIRAVIAEQKKSIEYQRDNIIPLTQSLIVSKQDLIDFQVAELFPAMELLNNAIKRWALERPAVISAQMDKAQATLNLSNRQEALTLLMLAAAREKLDHAESLSDLLPLRGEAASAEINHATNLVLQANADLALANAEKDLAESQQRRISPLQQKAEALGRFATKQGDVAAAMLVDVENRMRAASARILAATYRIAAMDSEIGSLLAEVSSDRAKNNVEIVKAQIGLIEKRSDAARIEAEVAGLSRVATAKEQHALFREAKLTEVAASQESRTRIEISERLRWRRITSLNKVDAEAKYHHAYGQSMYQQHLDIANTNAMRDVTSRLVHTISG